MWKDLETNEDLLGYKVHSMLLKNVVLLMQNNVVRFNLL